MIFIQLERNQPFINVYDFKVRLGKVYWIGFALDVLVNHIGGPVVLGIRLWQVGVAIITVRGHDSLSNIRDSICSKFSMRSSNLVNRFADSRFSAIRSLKAAYASSHPMDRQ